MGPVQAELSRLIAEVHAADMRHARVLDFIPSSVLRANRPTGKIVSNALLIIMRSIHSLLMRLPLMEAIPLCLFDLPSASGSSAGLCQCLRRDDYTASPPVTFNRR